MLNQEQNILNPIYNIAKSGIYLLARGSQNVYISTNNGASWSKVFQSFFNNYVFIHNDKVFVSSNSGFYSQPLLKFPTISSFKPLAGIIGSKVTIKGSGFSITPSKNSISLGWTSTSAETASEDSLTFKIPPDAISSTLSVSVNGQNSSVLDTLFIIPDITYFSPEKAAPRSGLAIVGTGFSPIPTENIVTIGGKPSFVGTAARTRLEVSVPDSAIVGSGKVSVAVKGYIGSSPFTVTQAPPLPSPGGSGNIAWTQAIKAGFICKSMAIDSKNNLLFTGQLANYGGRARQYFNNSLFSGYSFDSYLIKSDTSYNIKWKKIIKSWSSTASSFQPVKIQTDKNDNIVLVGSISNSITIDSLTVTLPGIKPSRYGFLIAKISATGKLLWYNFIRASSFIDAINDLKIDNEGNIYIAGKGSETWNFYNDNKEVYTINASNNGTFGYFARYNSDGVFDWVKSFTEGYGVSINALEIDKIKNIYVTGSWYGTGNIELIPKKSSSEDIIIAKFDSLRKLVWLKQIGANYNDIRESGNDIALDQNLNSLYVTGSFISGDFGGGETKSEDQNIFLTRYSLQGDLVWLKKMGSWSGAASFTEFGNKVMVDRSGFVFLGGVLGPLSLGFDGIDVGAYRDPSNSNFYNDGFLGKFSATGKLLWAQHFGDPNFDDYLTDLKKNDNNLYFTGVAGRDAIFGRSQPPVPFGGGFVSRIKDQKENLFELSESAFQIDADKNLTKQFQIITNKGWTLSSNADWLSINLPNGKGNFEVILSAKSNNSTQRSGVITATSEGGIIKLINVQQLGSANPIVTGISSTEKIRFNVFPNPAIDKLKLDTDLDSSEFQVKITDSMGRELVNTYITGFEIDIKHLPSGVYFIKVSASNNQFVLRFVKL